ncbi:MAG: tRNA (adenosine(37)-N6)-dimethylallyltransferase MiaA [Rickettsiales bacterium]|jgi:tRNA dimethylallyltransferase|nr:tRNA (adenosine(37)-N6)-dimethylallyltransferase MiaA [Rickettsiales bacterium]
MDKDATIKIIFGPTACGKSDFALGLARKENCAIINIDSRQVFKDLPLLTAAPSRRELAAVPHLLYSFAPPSFDLDAQKYCRMAAQAIEGAREMGRTPLFVGGTGFYVQALIEGLSPIPDVPRINDGTFEELLRIDPILAAKIPPRDTQRINRAVAVFRATKKPLSYFQSLPRERLVDEKFRLEIMDLPIARLESRIKERFDKMMAQGVVDQVAALPYVAENPIEKVCGIRHIRDYVKGVIDRDEMRRRVILDQRRYAKRQRTFARMLFKTSAFVKES